MDIHSIRTLLRTKSIFDIPLRVTYYARVSSDSDEQLNSLGNQITYYEDLIKANKHWTFVPGYIDEGISGISTRKRENFNRMIDDAGMDLFDMVITKEISRFARNTLDSIQFTRQLLSCGVGVFFQNDNINTFDEDSELRLSIMSSIAQDELRKLSSRIKFGHQQAIKDGVVLGNNRIFGYTKDNGRLVIDEDEAVMVRELFTLYATNHYSMKQIEVIFWDKGYRNHNGKRISHTTMSGMISNPKYKGYYAGNKYKVIDMFTKKAKSLPHEEWVMFKDETGEIVPAIVSEELWEAANTVLRRRSNDVKYRQGICNHANLLTGKLICAHCGVAYYRKESVDKAGNKNSRWVCSGKIKNGAHSCASLPIYEEELKSILLDLARDTQVATDAMITAYTEMFQAAHSQTDLAKRIEAAQQRRDMILKKKSKLLEYNVSGKISDIDFIQMNKACADEIAEVEAQIEEMEMQEAHKDEFRKQIAALKSAMRAIEAAVSTGAITKDFVDDYIDKIFITPENGHTMQLEVRFFTGESTKLYFEKLKGRTGQLSKKMIEAYEQNMQ
jgi:DNA invertase Pin-like site-specific DNA recombinase